MSPRKLCQCGCGEPTKGRWCRGHQWIHRRLGLPESESLPPNPSGLCGCGCGKKTSLATKTDHLDGNVLGKPLRFIRGHVSRERNQKNARAPIVPIGPSIAYIPLTKGQFALIEIEDLPEIAPWNWTAVWMENTKSYSAVRTRRPGRVGMHQQLCPRNSGLMPDHKNGNTLDNRRNGNLRPATNQQNLFNSRRRKDNTSGVKGVRFRKGLFSAAIKINGKSKHLISTPDRELAAEAYRKAAVEAAGEFARFA